jgi:ribosomal protein uL23
MNNHPVILHPLATEKSIKLMESENKLIFAVGLKSTKPQIKEAIEKEFNVKVKQVRTTIDPDGTKKAYVRFSDETPAIDVATKLGLM